MRNSCESAGHQRLPLEIWLAIFSIARKASRDPLYPPEHIIHFDFFMDSPEQKRLKDIMVRAPALGATSTWEKLERSPMFDLQVMKASASRVCREWNATLTPLLYEHVILQNIRALNEIVRTLQDRSHLGPHIRRLDVLLADLPPYTYADTAARTNQLKLLLTTASQLGCLVLPPLDHLLKGNYLPENDFFSILPCISTSLECIRWLELVPEDTECNGPRGKNGMEIETWISFLASHPGIKSIQHPRLRKRNQDSMVVQAHFPIIHSTDATSSLDGHLRSYLGQPSSIEHLATLRLVFRSEEYWRFQDAGSGYLAPRVLSNPTAKVAQIPPVLTYLGAKIDSVHFIYCPPPPSMSTDDPTAYHNSTFKYMQKECSNLRELGCTFLWEVAYTLRFTFPHVETLNLSMSPLFAPRLDERYGNMLEFVRRAIRLGRVPKLKQVLVLDERDVTYLKANRVEMGLDKFIVELGKAGVTVESWEDSSLL